MIKRGGVHQVVNGISQNYLFYSTVWLKDNRGAFCSRIIAYLFTFPWFYMKE